MKTSNTIKDLKLMISKLTRENQAIRIEKNLISLKEDIVRLQTAILKEEIENLEIFHGITPKSSKIEVVDVVEVAQ